ncbi:MAG: aminotransferase class III-fold pyridoxal phosphate-dependent enzyme, partial [Actinomycetes bacterium]
MSQRQPSELNLRYQQSTEWLARAEQVIPLASQTFSKSRTQLPVGAAPLFAARAKGSKLWDIDGNEYIDLTSALACVTLGYAHPVVDEAIKRQLVDGITLSLPHQLECEVAERIVAAVPSAEMVRFAKNGSDATSGAVRLARAHTGRDHVAVCGYHGWHDWYIGSTTRNDGVPRAVRELTHRFNYNNLESLAALFDAHPDQFAAVVMEPMNVEFPKPGFLEGVADLCRQHGTLLVFDETITGFRFSRGGAQTLFGIEPDLSTFGKGLANGMPLSAVVGGRALMLGMEEIFYSGTFGGETLSLAAAVAVLDFLEAEPVIETLNERGSILQGAVRSLIVQTGCSDFLALGGHPSWQILGWREGPEIDTWGLKTLFMQEMFRNGVFTIGSHNLSYAHSIADIDAVIAVYERV